MLLRKLNAQLLANRQEAGGNSLWLLSGAVYVLLGDAAPPPPP